MSRRVTVFSLGATEQSSNVLLLKLHGSINWLVSVFGGARGGSVFALPLGALSLGGYPVITRSDFDFLGYGEFSGRVFEGGGAFPCLILPGRKKEFFYDTSLGKEHGEFWHHLWSQAKQAVSTCDKIVICGYSLPAADERALDLLLESPRRKLMSRLFAARRANASPMTLGPPDSPTSESLGKVTSRVGCSGKL